MNTFAKTGPHSCANISQVLCPQNFLVLNTITGKTVWTYLIVVIPVRHISQLQSLLGGNIQRRQSGGHFGRQGASVVRGMVKGHRPAVLHLSPRGLTDIALQIPSDVFLFDFFRRPSLDVLTYQVPAAKAVQLHRFEQLELLAARPVALPSEYTGGIVVLGKKDTFKQFCPFLKSKLRLFLLYNSQIKCLQPSLLNGTSKNSSR